MVKPNLNTEINWIFMLYWIATIIYNVQLIWVIEIDSLLSLVDFVIGSAHTFEQKQLC